MITWQANDAPEGGERWTLRLHERWALRLHVGSLGLAHLIAKWSPTIISSEGVTIVIQKQLNQKRIEQLIVWTVMGEDFGEAEHLD